MAKGIRIYDPTASTSDLVQQRHHTLDDLTGKVVGFIDNTKPNFNYLVDDLAELLIGTYGVRSVIKRGKRVAAVPAPETILRELVDQCDLVIAGSGD